MLVRGRGGPTSKLAWACVTGVCTVALLGCNGANSDAGAGAKQHDAGPKAPRALYQLSGLPMRFGDVPWPDDAYLNDVGRISVRDIPTSAPSDYAESLGLAMDDLDGFGIRPTVYFRFDSELDPASLPSAPDDSVMATASVFLVDLDVASPQAFERIAVDVRYDAQRFEVRLRPAYDRALVPGRRYAAVVTRQVRAADGQAVEAAESFVRVRDATPHQLDSKQRRARTVYAPVVETLVDAGIARDRIVALAVFHVQSVRDDLALARALVRAEAAPVPTIAQVIAQPDLDAILGRGRAPGFDDGGPHDHIGWMVHGRFNSPNLLSPRGATHGVFRRDDGALRVRSHDDVPFTLWLPRVVTANASLPVAIVQHGLGHERSDALPIANALAGLGYATLAIDAPFHGMRADAGDQSNRFTGEATPDGFGDSPGDFAGVADERGELLPLHPFYYRDALRQGVVDAMGAVALLQQSDWSVLGEISPALVDAHLRTDQLAFVGFDVGAEIGVALASFEPSIGALVVGFGGGSTVDEWFDSPRSNAPLDALLVRLGRDPNALDEAREDLLSAPDVDAWRTLADRASPLAHAPALRQMPTNVLLLMARDDEVVHNRSSEALANALGADIAGGEPGFVPELHARSLRPGATERGQFRDRGRRGDASAVRVRPRDARRIAARTRPTALPRSANAAVHRARQAAQRRQPDRPDTGASRVLFRIAARLQRPRPLDLRRRRPSPRHQALDGTIAILHASEATPREGACGAHHAHSTRSEATPREGGHRLALPNGRGRVSLPVIKPGPRLALPNGREGRVSLPGHQTWAPFGFAKRRGRVTLPLSERDVAVLLRRVLVALVLRASRARAISAARVSRGRMTSSTKPRSAAMYGLANFSRYSSTNARARRRRIRRRCVDLVAVDDVDRALGPHHRDLGRRPGEVDVGADVLATP